MKKILDLANNIILYFVNLPYSADILFSVAIKERSIHVFYCTEVRHLSYLREDLARHLPTFNDCDDPINVVVRNVTIQQYQENEEFYHELFRDMTTIKFPHVIESLKYRRLKEKLPPILPVFSYSGGVGKTTLSLAIAECLGYDNDKVTLIVDMSFNNPMYVLNSKGIVEWCSYLNEMDRINEDINNYVSKLNYTHVYCIGSGISSNKEVDSEYDFRKTLCITHKDYYIMLLSILRQDPPRFMDLIIDLIERVCETIKADVVIIDCQAGHNEFTEPLLAICKTALYITNSNVSNTLYAEHLLDCSHDDAFPILVSAPSHDEDKDYSLIRDDFSESIYHPEIVMVPYIKMENWDRSTREQIVKNSKNLDDNTSLLDLVYHKLFII